MKKVLLTGLVLILAIGAFMGCTQETQDTGVSATSDSAQAEEIIGKWNSAEEDENGKFVNQGDFAMEYEFLADGTVIWQEPAEEERTGTYEVKGDEIKIQFSNMGVIGTISGNQMDLLQDTINENFEEGQKRVIWIKVQ